MKWHRREGGYMSADEEWFLLRGAPMTHGANAWLIHRRVTGDRVGTEGTIAFDTRDGSPLWTIDLTGYADTADSDTTETLYAHEFDAGWLSEAKHIVDQITEKEAAA